MDVGAKALTFGFLDDFIATEDKLLTGGKGGSVLEILNAGLGLFDGGRLVLENEFSSTFTEGVELVGSADKVSFAVDLDDGGFATTIAGFDDS